MTSNLIISLGGAVFFVALVMAFPKARQGWFLGSIFAFTAIFIILTVIDVLS